MGVVERFIEVLNRQADFHFSRSRCLVAVSGGVDSMVLLDLCVKMKMNIMVAHCNFQLRGQQSEQDQAFVQKCAHARKVAFLTQSFPIQQTQQQHKKSIELLARQARYTWFAECVDKYSLDYILTAHHADDNVETALMNFCRSTGLMGLAAMPYRNGNILRPLLDVTKKDIYHYASEHNIPYRQDSTNDQDVFTRNFYRNRVLPLIALRTPGVRESIRENIKCFQEIAQIYNGFIARETKRIVKKKGDRFVASVQTLRELEPQKTWLYEIFKPFCPPAQVEMLAKMVRAPAGKYFQTEQWRFVRSQDVLIVEPLRQEEPMAVSVQQGQAMAHLPVGNVYFCTRDRIQTETFTPNKECIDEQQIAYPLCARPWKSSDYFYPLGLAKKKKITRFLRDLRVPYIDKAGLWVLEDAEKKIIAILGVRIDDRVKIRAGTKKIVEFSFQQYHERHSL